MRLVGYYLAAASVIAILITVYDKLAAKGGIYRIPEKTLLITAFVGGALAMYSCMLLIRHKTKKKKFMITLPLFCVLHLVCLFCLYNII